MELTNIELQKILEPFTNDYKTRSALYHIIKTSVSRIVTINDTTFIKENDTLLVNNVRVPVRFAEDAFDAVTNEDSEWIPNPFDIFANEGKTYYFSKKNMYPGSAAYLSFEYVNGAVCEVVVNGFIADVVKYADDNHYVVMSEHVNFDRFTMELVRNTKGDIINIKLN